MTGDEEQPFINFDDFSELAVGAYDEEFDAEMEAFDRFEEDTDPDSWAAGPVLRQDEEWAGAIRVPKAVARRLARKDLLAAIEPSGLTIDECFSSFSVIAFRVREVPALVDVICDGETTSIALGGTWLPNGNASDP